MALDAAAVKAFVDDVYRGSPGEVRVAEYAFFTKLFAFITANAVVTPTPTMTAGGDPVVGTAKIT